MDATYNDVQEWQYKELVGVFGAEPDKSKTYQVKTKQEAEDLFQDKEFASAACLQVGLPIENCESMAYLIFTVCGASHAQRRRPKGAQADCPSIRREQC